jgi:hypothetical protein
MPVEYFVCPCPETANVILDGNDQGPNKYNSGKLWTKQCGTGLHIVALQCKTGKTCTPAQVVVEIKDTDPIFPMEVAFQCES